MEIKDKKILALGGLGMVGTAVCRLVLKENPKLLVVASLKKYRERKALRRLCRDFPNKKIVIEWRDILADQDLPSSPLYQLILKYKPEIIVDTINTATVIAYQHRLKGTKRHPTEWGLNQLIRHIQILYQATRKAKTQIYIKVGTTGVGGMGLNIPYTHGENKPSYELLAKIAVAGAHTQLLQILGRTPGAPIVKEVKPATAIAWGELGFGRITINDAAVPISDCPLKKALELKGVLDIKTETGSAKKPRRFLKSIYIDNGESGLYALEEFKALTRIKQMEFVTPEEVAQHVLNQIKARDNSKDVILALDNSTVGPSYRAGLLRDSLISKVEDLKRRYRVDSVAFETLGPPRISKLLFEAYLLKKNFKSLTKVCKEKPKNIAKKLDNFVDKSKKVRESILSIGVPILLSDGQRLLCGSQIKIPPKEAQPIQITKGNIEKWARAGWVDLREENVERWQKRFKTLMEQIDSQKNARLSSASDKTFLKRDSWRPDYQIDVGDTVGWLFIHEEKSERLKE